jgi:hypothetical protein
MSEALGGVLAGSSYDIRDFREALLLSLDEHRLANTAFYDEIVQSPEVPAASLYAIAWFFLKHSPPASARLIDDIVHHPAVDPRDLRNLAATLTSRAPEGEPGLLLAIGRHPRADAETRQMIRELPDWKK